MGPLNATTLAPRLLRALNDGAPYSNVIFHVNVQSFYSYGKSATHSAEALAELAGALTGLVRELPELRLNWVVRNAICGEADVVARVRRAAHEGGVPTFLTFEAAATAVAAMSGEA
jgi:hypothetical protein